MDSRAYAVLKEIKETVVNRALLDHRVQLVHVDTKASKGQLVHKAFKDQKVIRVIRDCVVRRANKDHRVVMDTRQEKVLTTLMA